MLTVKNLVKRYQGDPSQPAGGIFGADFQVKKGEMFTLLGPSGCGKTTTLRSIAGLEHPEDGTIVLDGAELFNGRQRSFVPMYDRDIGMVFQSYAIWPHMTVFENAAYPLRVARRRRFARDEIERRVMRILEMVGLASYRSRSATQLSGGQQQRLALARALVREPKLLLLDEPLSNLDAQLRDQMRNELKRIQLESGVTTLYVTHDQSEAMAISDRIAVINKGLIVQLGSPDEIYDMPRSEFTANFIGRSNIFRGSLETAVNAHEAGVVASNIGPVRCQFADASAAGSSISFVVRPENVVLSAANGAGPAENTFDGKVVARVYLGDIAEYSVQLQGGSTVIARAHPRVGLTIDDPVIVHLPPEHVIAVRPSLDGAPADETRH